MVASFLLRVPSNFPYTAPFYLYQVYRYLLNLTFHFILGVLYFQHFPLLEMLPEALGLTYTAGLEPAHRNQSRFINSLTSAFTPPPPQGLGLGVEL